MTQIRLAAVQSISCVAERERVVEQQQQHRYTSFRIDLNVKDKDGCTLPLFVFFSV